MIEKLKLFYRFSRRRQCLLALTVGCSFYSWVLMRLFNQYARFEGLQKPAKIFDYQLIANIRWAIFVVNKYVPWQNVCRHQAYQAKLLCQFYGVPYQVFVGFKKNAESGQIDGHAWTMVGAEMVTGFCNPSEYTTQAIYQG